MDKQQWITPFSPWGLYRRKLKNAAIEIINCIDFDIQENVVEKPQTRTTCTE